MCRGWEQGSFLSVWVLFYSPAKNFDGSEMIMYINIHQQMKENNVKLTTNTNNGPKDRFRYGPIWPHPPPFWKLNHANSAYFGAISANFETRPPTGM